MAEHKYLLGLYDDEEPLLDAIHKIKDSGIEIHDVMCPFPVHGLDDALDARETKLHNAGFLFGATGTLFALLAMSGISVLNWPNNFGGKPFFSLPSWIPISFELTVLFSAVGMTIVYYLRNGLSVFKDIEPLEPRTTSDRFAIVFDVSEGDDHDDGHGHAETHIGIKTKEEQEYSEYLMLKDREEYEHYLSVEEEAGFEKFRNNIKRKGYKKLEDFKDQHAYDSYLEFEDLQAYEAYLERQDLLEFEKFRKAQTQRSYKEKSSFKSEEEYREYRDLKDQEEYEIFRAIKEQEAFEDFRANKSKYIAAGESESATTAYDDQAAEVNRLTNLLTHLGAIEVKTKTLSKRHPSHEEQSTRGFAKGTN